MTSGELVITIDDAPSDEDRETIELGLRAYNEPFVGPREHRSLAVYIRDAGGAVRGGLIGGTGRGWLGIELFWVEESLRGQGWGSRLLEMAEREAIARGCTRSHLDTATFQAPGFYRRHGHEEVGRIEDIGNGHDVIYLVKQLVREGRPDP